MTRRDKWNAVLKKLQSAAADAKLSRDGHFDFQRYCLLSDALSDAATLVREIGKDADIFGEKKREQEAASKRRALPPPMITRRPDPVLFLPSAAEQQLVIRRSHHE